MDFSKQSVLHRGKRIQMRKATKDDLDFIMRLEFDRENVKFIVPFDREFHTKLIELDGKMGALDIVLETIDMQEPVGYLLVEGLNTEQKECEWMHVVIDVKGKGYTKTSSCLRSSTASTPHANRPVSSSRAATDPPVSSDKKGHARAVCPFLLCSCHVPAAFSENNRKIQSCVLFVQYQTR